jgi:peptide/nickel transport system permease protein
MIWIENIIILLGAATFLLAVRKVFQSDRWERAINRLKKDRMAKICIIFVSIYFCIAILDSIQIPAPEKRTRSVLDYIFQNIPQEKSYSAPLSSHTYSPTKPEPLQGWHLFGTDALGKDVFIQSLKACRTALIIGSLTSLILIPIGIILGITAGYFKGWIDDLIQYIYITVSSIPSILLLIAILMVLKKDLVSMSIALSITGWVGLCRLLRGETLRQTGKPYIEAARALGQTNWVIISRHILPNVMHLVLINFILGFSGLVMAETILSYIGVGAPIGTASWGIMIDLARMELAREPAVWWNFSAAMLTLFFLVLPLNLLGDSLRRAFDPKSK